MESMLPRAMSQGLGEAGEDGVLGSGHEDHG